MTLNGVGSRTRLGLPAGGPRCKPLSCAHRPQRGAEAPQARGSHAAGCSWAHPGCGAPATRALALHLRSQSAELSMKPREMLLRLLMATLLASAVAGAPGTALSPTTGDATLAFVFDVTGSMWDDLMQVIEGASRILERSLSSHSRAIANYALVPFHDPGSVPASPTGCVGERAFYPLPAWLCAPRAESRARALARGVAFSWCRSQSAHSSLILSCFPGGRCPAGGSVCQRHSKASSWGESQHVTLAFLSLAVPTWELARPPVGMKQGIQGPPHAGSILPFVFR